MAWKVGELSRLTGLTVRTLHHYERIGLLTPSGRTGGGHRLYDEADVTRLYRIVALRELGLPLDAVGTALAGELDLADLLRSHLEQVGQQLTALRALHARLSTLVSAGRAPYGPDDLLALMDEVNTVEDTMRNYFSEEQIQALAERRAQLGPEATAAAEREWPELIAKVQAELDAGTDPAEPRVQELAARWWELLEGFHGGDPGLRDGLYRMRDANSEQIQREYGGPSDALIAYVTRAREAAAG